MIWPGFNYFAREWLESVDLNHGIRGEGDIPFPMFLEQLQQNGDRTSIPGSICREGNRV